MVKTRWPKQNTVAIGSRWTALSVDILLSPNMYVMLGERQCVALLRSAWEKYKCLNVQIYCEYPKLFVMVSNQISRLFGDTFFFNSALSSFFVFLLCLVFFSLDIFLSIMFSSFFIVSKFISNVQCKQLWNESQTSPSLAVPVFECITSLSTFSSLAVSV